MGLVPLLGKRSGYEEGYDKEKECSRAGFPWINVQCTKLFSKDISGHDDSERNSLKESHSYFDGMKVLPRCQSYIALKMIDSIEGGDHELALCEIIGVGAWDKEGGGVLLSDGAADPKDETSVLYTGALRKEGVI